MSASNGKPAKPSRSFDLHAFSDEELLHLVKDNLDTEGWVTSAELADAIGIPDDEESRLNGIGIRLGWMARYGVIQKDKEHPTPTRWTLTGRGIVVLEATFSKGLQTQLEGIKGEALWSLARTVTDRYGQADDVSAVLVRRSFQRAYQRRRYGR
jgi:hypothetical protein